LKRGDVVTIALGGGFGGKPRPALVIQSDLFDTPDTVIVALFTSDLRGTVRVRPRFAPTPTNGLRETSDLMVDVVATGRRSKIGTVVGRLDRNEMRRAEGGLLSILGFAG
jgi:mRNA interferase MazF